MKNSKRKTIKYSDLEHHVLRKARGGPRRSFTQHLAVPFHHSAKHINSIGITITRPVWSFYPISRQAFWSFNQPNASSV
jgi:hypothetical protein